MTKRTNQLTLDRIDKEIKKYQGWLNEARRDPKAGGDRMHIQSQIDGLNTAREIVRLETPDKDRLDVLIELISNSMDHKPQSVQVQNFELYFQVSAAIAHAPKRYIIRLLQALHYFRNQLN